MPYPGYTTDEVGRRGRELYEQQLRARVEPAHAGQFLVLDIQTGDYEIAGDDLTASDRLLARKPQAVLYGVRIGSPAAYRLGGHFLPEEPYLLPYGEYPEGRESTEEDFKTAEWRGEPDHGYPV
jgi:hypothetical protein